MPKPDLNSLIPMIAPLLGGMSEEELAAREAMLEFARDKMAPSFLRDRAEHEIDHETLRLCNQTYGGLLVPVEYGGQLSVTPGDGGLSLATAIAIGEDLARYRPGLAVTAIATQAFLASGVAAFGTPEQKARILPAIVRGEIIGGLGLTEKRSGSAAFESVDTTAQKTGDATARLNGEKQWCTNGPILDSVIVAAKDPGTGAVSNFLVHKGAEGFTQGPQVKKWPIPDSATGSLFFEDTPAELLGQWGAGKKQTMSILTIGRVGVSTLSNGGIRTGIEEPVPYIMDRLAHGKSLAEHPINTAKIGQMYAALLQSQLMTRNAAMLVGQCLPQLFGAGEAIPLNVQGAASIAKLVASTVVRSVLLDGIQLMASGSVLEDVTIFAHFVDHIIGGIFEGTQEIQAEGVGKLVLGAFRLNGWVS